MHLLSTLVTVTVFTSGEAEEVSVLSEIMIKFRFVDFGKHLTVSAGQEVRPDQVCLSHQISRIKTLVPFNFPLNALNGSLLQHYIQITKLSNF